MTKPSETMEQPIKENDELTAAVYSTRANSSITPQARCASCGGQGGTSGLGPNGVGGTAYAYAVGRIEARFPNLAAEKEFAQATGRADTAGKTDHQAFHAGGVSVRICKNNINDLAGSAQA